MVTRKNIDTKGTIMTDLRKQLDAALLQVQEILDEHFEENESVQDAFNSLACAIDDEMASLY
jgi:hypothetical protein